MGVIVVGQFDRFRPTPFDVEPEAARRMNADHDMATTVLLWAQEMRASCSRDLAPEKRAELLRVVGVIRKHPDPQ